ncbi:S41 family peptidase [Gilvimarinus sp. F26214L]|uniref:S41 family peptidase n=1 Tax=Gilvimarinus sp. DZF01 TaxID=3461371 RepID=UPI004045AF1A
MSLDRQGETEYMKPEQKTNDSYYSGPLVVLINGGVRSGKEALAYQFKKTARATLVGTTTAGAFVGGLGGFANEDRGLILYLAVFGMFLDDREIEGKGISPDIEVAPDHGHHDDPQLERAILEVIRVAR